MRRIIYTLMAFALLIGCKPAQQEQFHYFFPDGPDEEETSPDPGVSADPSTEDPSAEDPSGEEPSAEESSDPAASKVPCWIWIDSSANFPDFSTGEENIRRDLQKAADAGFTHIIAEVRPTTGDLLFKSSHCTF